MVTEEQRMLRELHSFWYAPPIKGQPPRIEQFDTLLTHYRTGRSVLKVIVWLGAGAVALSAGITKVMDVLAHAFTGSP